MTSHPIFPFMVFEDSLLRPVMWVRFAKADGSWTQPIMAQIDTGSDYCNFPGEIIEELGGKLEKGKKIWLTGIGGDAVGYIHYVTMEALKTGEDGGPAVDANGHHEFFRRMSKRKMIFVPKGTRCYLGVMGFLEHFLLRIDYPNSCFSLLDGGE